MSDLFEFDDRNHAERFVGTLHDPQATVGDVLTVQADKSIAARPGGGGAGGVQVVTVPVSSAEILSLGTVDVVLVAGVPGFFTVVGALMVAYLAGGTPYLDGGGGIQAMTRSVSDPANVVIVASSLPPPAGFWDQATDQFIPEDYGNQPTNTFATAEYDGQDLILTGGGASPTLGDGTLLVTVSYFLAPTV